MLQLSCFKLVQWCLEAIKILPFECQWEPAVVNAAFMVRAALCPVSVSSLVIRSKGQQELRMHGGTVYLSL